MKHYGDIIKGKPGAIQKVQDILKDDVNEEVINEKMTAAQKKKRYEMIKKAVEKINARNLKRAKADAMKMMKSSGLFDEEKELEEKGPGLWANIHKRRKSGKPMRKKGEKGAPTAAAMRQAKGESVDEGIYTKDDGGAYDGLRIAKYLAHEDGHTNWKRLSYGQVQDYLDQGMEMLQRDKSKARSILAKPTPRI